MVQQSWRHTIMFSDGSIETWIERRETPHGYMDPRQAFIQAGGVLVVNRAPDAWPDHKLRRYSPTAYRYLDTETLTC